MNHFRSALFFALLVTAGTARLEAGILVDHQPHRTGGLGSDTEFLNSFNQPVWQRLADDIILADPVTVEHIKWWGFYNLDVTPASETMRIRFYGARQSDGLPDDSAMLYEQSIVNPSRVWTGRTILVDFSPKEYLYISDLSIPVKLDAGVKYWLEIVQIGDLSTAFRWEFSLAERNGFASVNSINSNWHTVTLAADCAFQLIGIPEPTTIPLLILACLAFKRSFNRR